LTLLRNVSVVLVEPATLANIGATARVLKNTGIPRLVLVGPPDSWDSNETRYVAHAAGDILDACEVFPDLAAAVADAHVVIGATHRTGRYRDVDADPSRALTEVAALAARQRISLVFGRERDGLWREELSLCHRLMRFPTAVDYPSLNLSHAVLLFAYQIFAACQQAEAATTPQPPMADDREHLLTAGEREQLLEHVSATLTAIDFRPHNSDPRNFSRVLRRLLNKIALDNRDAGVLHRICGQVHKYAARRREPEAGPSDHPAEKSS
jgi:tRNA (cytidine32/uridine32-2'-O)-methyltransferase